MQAVFAPARTNVRSFRLAQPVVQASSWPEFSACALLTLAAVGVWLLVLPLELLRLLAA